MNIHMYIKCFFMLFLACNNNIKKTIGTEIFIVNVTFVGEIDKPLPTLSFLNSCEETFKLFDYNYTLNYNSYIVLKEEIQSQDSKIKDNSSLIRISFNGEKSYYLSKERSLLFISKLLNVTMYKDNEQLKNQLNLYLKVLKSR